MRSNYHVGGSSDVPDASSVPSISRSEAWPLRTGGTLCDRRCVVGTDIESGDRGWLAFSSLISWEASDVGVGGT